MTTHVIEIPFHIGDFLSGTMHIDGTEIGAYWMLCVAHYQAGVEGLDDDDKQLARIAKVSTKVWTRIRPIVAKKFTLEDGHWRHKKVVNVLQKMSDIKSQNSAKSLKRWRSSDPPALPVQSQPITIKKEQEKIESFKQADPPVEQGAPNPDNPYWFTGSVIRLRRKDYDEMLEVYGGTDQQFMGWLNGRDRWFRDMASPQAKKNWFLSTWAAIRKLVTP